MDLEPSFEIHIQRTLVVLLSPRSLPVPLNRISCRIPLRNAQAVSTELVASSIQKCGAYSLSSLRRRD